MTRPSIPRFSIVASFTAFIASLILSGCTRSDDGAVDAAPPLTANTLGEQTILKSSDYLAMQPYAGADLELGERAARVCRACHTLDAGGINMMGPNLHDFFGRAAGSMPDYQFSQALRNAGFVWTPRALDAWLKAPARFLPGNRMSFAGVNDERTRNALIAYLIRETAKEAVDEAPADG